MWLKIYLFLEREPGTYGHSHIQTAVDGRSSGVGCTPVAHNETPEVVFLLEYGVQRVIVFATPGSIELVVAAHDSTDASLNHASIRPSPDFMQSALANVGSGLYR